jgi:hypothetical protein
VATTAVATRVAAVLDVETFAQEATTVRDSTVVYIRDVEDWAALAERDAQEMVLRAQAENVATLAFAHEDAEGLVWKVALHKGELVQARQAREVAKVKICSLSDAAATSVWWLVVFEREHWEQFEELSLL